MGYEIQRGSKDGVEVLTPHGRLTLGEPVIAFRKLLEAMFADGAKRVVVDLSDVDYIDSSALGGLVYAHTLIERAGGAMSIFGLDSRQMELMVITKLYTVFRIADNESDAINYCYPERETHGFDILSFVQQQREAGGKE
jgi:anti-sigma B factor antagonist